MRLCDLDEIKVCVDRQYKNCHGYSGSKKAIYREAILAVKSILHSAKPIDGVTVQEWISVDDRLPSDEQDVLVIAHGWGGRLVYVGSHKRVEAQKSWPTGITNKSSEWLLWGWSYLKEPMVTHWMPLPNPPKGE